MSSTMDADTVRPGATTDDLRRQAKAVKEDLRELGHTAKEVAREKLGEAKQKAAGVVDESKQRTAEYYQRGKQEAARFEDQVETYIRENPLKSVMIATGLGVVLGMFLSRR